MSKSARPTTVFVLGLITALALAFVWGANIVTAQGCVYQTNVLADSPIAYWRLGDASNPAVNIGSLGNAVDGTYQSGVTLGVSGLVLGDPDSAASFDGSSGYVTIPNHSAINTSGPYDAKTIELWFSATDPLTGTQVLYEQGGGTLT